MLGLRNEDSNQTIHIYIVQKPDAEKLEAFLSDFWSNALYKSLTTFMEETLTQ
jgi:hypothetical protein